MTDPIEPSPLPSADESLSRAETIVPHASTAPPLERARVEAPAQRTSALPLLYLLGFLVLVGAVGYLFLHPPGSDLAATETATTTKLTALASRVAELEQRPVPVAPNLVPLESRIAGLEGRLAGLEARPPPPPPPPVDLGPLTAKLDVGTATLTGRMDTLERRVAGAEQMAKADADKTDQIGAQVDAKMGAALGTVDAKLGQANAQIASQLDAKFDAKLGQSTAALTSQVDAKLGTLTDTARRLASLQVVGAALEAGQKLGPMPGAPPALARYADQAPPTEFVLRQSFGPAADAALRASQPVVMEDKPFLDRLWTRAQQSVSVREGDRVLLGDPVAGVIAKARAALNGGDLAASLTALQALSGPPKAAMADWIGQAQGLLDARAAVAQLAAHG